MVRDISFPDSFNSYGDICLVGLAYMYAQSFLLTQRSLKVIRNEIDFKPKELTDINYFGNQHANIKETLVTFLIYIHKTKYIPEGVYSTLKDICNSLFSLVVLSIYYSNNPAQKKYGAISILNKEINDYHILDQKVFERAISLTEAKKNQQKSINKFDEYVSGYIFKKHIK